MTDVEGRWCHTDPFADELGTRCVVIALPQVWSEYDGELESEPEYVLPRGRAADSEPSDWRYDFDPEPSGCFSAGIDGWPATSGGMFYFCPAGASDSENISSRGDVTLDRLYMTQEFDSYPWVRADL